MDEQIGAAQKATEIIIDLVTRYGLQVLGALVILVVGIFVARAVADFVERLCAKKDVNVTLRGFLAKAVRIAVLVFVVIVAMANFGISIAPFVAALGALAFGASFALQSPLSNYGAGLSIVLTRPFLVGDTLSVASVSGVVEDIKLAHTLLTTEDGERVMIPNKHIVGEILINSHANRIVVASIGVSYDDDPAEVIALIRDTIASLDAVPKEPEAQVGIESFGDSSVNIAYRYWAPTLHYYQTAYAVNLAVYQAIGRAGFTIPFPQREVAIISQAS